MKRPCRCTHLEDSHMAGARCSYCHCDAFRDATTEHTAGLRDLAVHALLIAKKELTRTFQVTPFFVFREPTGILTRFIVPDPAIMNDGKGKDALFGKVRKIIREDQIEAVMFVSDCWFGKATEKALSMPQEEFLAATRERGFETALAQGLITRSEAITVSVQNPVRAMLVNQLYDRDVARRLITYREVSVMEMAVDEFSGRQKMYGDLREENLR
jgi:hypothetical protein